MEINYEAHEVFNPDYLLEHLGFVAGVLELFEQSGTNIGSYQNSNIYRVFDEAGRRGRDILDQIRKAIDDTSTHQDP